MRTARGKMVPLEGERSPLLQNKPDSACSQRCEDSLQDNSSQSQGGDCDEIDPFRPTLVMNRWHKIKFYIGMVTLFPIRLVLSLAVITLGLILSHIMAIGIKMGPCGPMHPMKGWRWCILVVLRFLARLWIFIAGIYRIRVIGRRASREEAPILVAVPHSSFIDALIPTTLECSVVTRLENIKVPVMGVLLYVVQPILIDRALSESRTQTLSEIKRRSSDPSWPQVMIFPEGTCTNRTAILPFKKGPFLGGLPVQPVLYHYPNSLDYTSWTLTNPLYLLFVCYCQFCTYVEVEFLPVYHPSKSEKTDPQLYADNVRKMIARKLNLPLCNGSFREFQERLKNQDQRQSR